METTARGRASWLALIAVFALVAAACGGGAEEGAEGEGGEGGGAEEITLLHGIKGEGEQAALQKAIDAFEQSSGNTVNVEFSPQFETVVVTRVQGGNAPDVALYPQPSLLERAVGASTPLEEAGVDLGTLESELVPGMLETGTFEDQIYGVVVKLNLKSLLWYAKDDLGDRQPPETWDDMLALSDELSQEGGDSAPWCIGIESADATGWVATDWIEDIMLRLHGPEVYDQWIAGEVTFDSPEVREAFTMLEEIWLNEDYVLGGTTSILQTPFLDAAQPMFEDPAQCYLHRQAGFIEPEFPGGAELGTDYDVVFLPPIEDIRPALFQGDVAAVHSDSQVAGDFIEFLVSQEGQDAWLTDEGAGALSVRSDFDASTYPTEALQKQGELFLQAEVARFDGSDQMPSEVGTGAFWSEVVAWISGGQDLDTTLTNIDAAWPAE